MRRTYELFFVEDAAAGYGPRSPRIYLSVDSLRRFAHLDEAGIHERSANAHNVLKFLSHWGGHDKTWEDSLGVVFFGYEMSQKMAESMAELLTKKGFQREVPFKK